MEHKQHTDNADHYNSNLYQETVRIERGAIMGIAEEETYERETEFSLQNAGIELQEGDRVLDLASGAAKHIACMDKQFNGKVQIDGVEKAAELAKIANTKVLAKAQEGVREHLAVHVGDMADIRGALPEGEAMKYKLITCLGSSFHYLNKAERQKALRDMFSLLEEGGKLVFQWREPDEKLQKDYWDNYAAQGRFEVYQDNKRGEEVTMLVDRERGDGFYHYHADCPHPDSEHQDDYERYIDDGEKGTKKVQYREKGEAGNGAPYMSFGRAYIPDITHPEQEQELGTTTVNNWLSSSRKTEVENELRELGFTGVQFSTDEKTLGHFHRIHTVVATKPSHEIERYVEHLQDRYEG